MIRLDFDNLQGRSIVRVCVLALYDGKAVEIGQGDVELLLDDGTEVVVTFDYDRGLILREGRAALGSLETLSDWFDLKSEYGVIVRAELPESDLRTALYGTPIEAVAIAEDKNFPGTLLRVQLSAGPLLVAFGVEDTICTLSFEPRYDRKE